MTILRTCCLLGIVLVCTQPEQVGAADKDAPPKPADAFKITNKKADDAVAVEGDKDKIIFDVTSPSGISDTLIARKDDKWPATVVVRLRLSGLEGLKVEADKTVLKAEVSSSNGSAKLFRVKDNKDGDALDEKSPYWMEIRIIGADGKPTKALPLKKGYFEMTLPKALFEDNPKAIKIGWIDVYRS